MSELLKPAGLATLPMRMTCALPAAAEPWGCSASSVLLETPGMSVPLVNSAGALNGGAISAAAATATRQSRLSTSVIASGLRAGSGYTERSTAAAICVGPDPGTRVVFFVANSGKPRLARCWSRGPTSAGGAESSVLISRPQPVAASAARSSSATSLGRGIAGTLAWIEPTSRRQPPGPSAPAC
jgi:hypothetical protein